MDNIRIAVKRANYITVIADSERFGKNEVMFEGNTFDQCFEYIKAVTGKEKLSLNAYIVDGIYKDRDGRSFPVYMTVNK